MATPRSCHLTTYSYAHTPLRPVARSSFPSRLSELPIAVPFCSAGDSRRQFLDRRVTCVIRYLEILPLRSGIIVHVFDSNPEAGPFEFENCFYVEADLRRLDILF